jgi:membrane-bound serine protease (ClpP class)
MLPIGKLVKFALIPLLVALVWMTVTAAPEGRPSSGPVLLLSIDDVIGPATEDYVQRAMLQAQRQHASLVVIRMDTPGGLDTAMRGIIKEITNSYIPVATYVGPTGARAASAGTYILYASHVAAMAPGTNLGAATPVQLGGLPGGEGEKKGDSAMQRKIMNDAVAYIRGLAALHGRNADWAERAVTEAASLPAEQALKQNVIDLMAGNVNELLRKLDGRRIEVMGEERTLHTTGLTIQELQPDWRSRLLSVLTNPNVAYILMLIGIYGLIFEFSSPGAGLPGVAGAICLLLALYSFHLLPINYAGMALILLGVGLMVGEAFAPSFGVLGIGGTIAFIIGSVILMDTEAPGYGIDPSVIVVFTLTSVVMFIFIVGMAVKSRHRPVVSGMEELIGGEATVVDDFEHSGRVKIHSETWSAVTDQAMHKGQRVRVRGVDGLTLEVEPMDDATQQEEAT